MINYQFNQFKIAARIEQFVPIDYHHINTKSSIQSTSKNSQFGGFQSQISLTYFFD